MLVLIKHLKTNISKITFYSSNFHNMTIHSRYRAYVMTKPVYLCVLNKGEGQRSGLHFKFVCGYKDECAACCLIRLPYRWRIKALRKYTNSGYKVSHHAILSPDSHILPHPRRKYVCYGQTRVGHLSVVMLKVAFRGSKYSQTITIFDASMTCYRTQSTLMWK